MYKYLCLTLFITSSFCSVSQTEQPMLKEFRYDIGYATKNFNQCDDLSKKILKLPGVTNCSCDNSANRITIYTKEKESTPTANEDDFKWIFLEYNLNIVKQKRSILTINGQPVKEATKKESSRSGGSNSPQKSKSVKISEKKDL